MTERLNAAVRRLHDAIAKRLLDQKKLVKGGWQLYRLQAVPDWGQGEPQVREFEQAFYAGAQHLFACIVSSMDEGTEPTDDDLRRMDNLADELEEFMARLSARLQQKGPPHG